MNFAPRLRPMMLLVLIAAAMTLFAGVVAPRPPSARRRCTGRPSPDGDRHPRSVADRHPVAYADGTLTLSRQSHHRQVRARAASAVTTAGPVAYADGTLTAARRQHPAARPPSRSAPRLSRSHRLA